MDEYIAHQQYHKCIGRQLGLTAVLALELELAVNWAPVLGAGVA